MPQIISKEDAAILGRRSIGKRHGVYVELENLETGLLLHITRADFKWKKRTPRVFINQISKSTGKKFTIVETKNRMGWVVERVE